VQDRSESWRRKPEYGAALQWPGCGPFIAISRRKEMLVKKLKAAGVAAFVILLAAVPAFFGASHREAPITALDRAADIADFYAFRSYDPAAPNTVTFILDVDPLLEPSNGPNYFPFDPDIVYSILVDNDNSATPALSFEFRFTTEIRAPQLFTGFAGVDGGANAPANSPPPVAPGTPVIPPAITALDGSGSAGLSLRQHYTVTMVQGNTRTVIASDANGKTLFAVPSNVGPRTMPNYPALAQQGIYKLSNGIRVFAGTVDDPFYIDLGAAFDSLNFRSTGFTIPGVLSDAQDADDSKNYAPDAVSGYNVNAIAIEVPISMLTRTGAVEGANSTAATIGAWGTTSRPGVTVRGPNPFPFVVPPVFRQVQRMGNPLINELIIGTGSKDFWSMSRPQDDAQFAGFALDPLLARVINAAYGGAVPIPAPPRTDLLPLVQYLPPIAAAGTPTGPVADLLRLNTGVPPTPPAMAHRLGLLAHDASGMATPDAAGFPNGRRVFDDVTDIAARAVVGVLTGRAPFNGAPNNRIGDGVNTNDVPYQTVFPYVAFAQSGRDRRHVDPGESGCAGVPGGICPTQ
jgi:hypothetical protein